MDAPTKAKLPIDIRQARTTRACLKISTKKGHLIATWKKGMGPEVVLATNEALPEAEVFRMMAELQKAAAEAGPGIEVTGPQSGGAWEEADDETFYVDREAGVQRWHGFMDRTRAYREVSRYGITVEEFEKSFGSSPPETYVLHVPRLPDEPDWVRVDEGLWLSPVPFLIKAPKEVTFVQDAALYWYLRCERNTREEGPGVSASVGVVPAWGCLSTEQQRQVIDASGVDLKRTSYFLLAEATFTFGMHAELFGYHLGWEEEDVRAKDFNIEDQEDKAVLGARLLFAQKPDIDKLMLQRMNGVGQDAWSFLFESVDDFLKRRASDKMTTAREIMNKMHGISGKKPD